MATWPGALIVNFKEHKDIQEEKSTISLLQILLKDTTAIPAWLQVWRIALFLGWKAFLCQESIEISLQDNICNMYELIKNPYTWKFIFWVLTFTVAICYKLNTIFMQSSMNENTFSAHSPLFFKGRSLLRSSTSYVSPHVHRNQGVVQYFKIWITACIYCIRFVK